MLPAERKRRIVDLVTERDGCSVAELASALDFSKATIRRDLQELDEEGRIERSHGGAVPISTVGVERPYDQREVANHDAKRAIAERAAVDIRDGEVVCIDSGTTTMALARALSEADVEAVTNMPDIATTLLDRGFKVDVTGGHLRPRTRALVGPAAESFLRQRHFDRVVLGTNGMTADGLSTPDESEASVKATMIDRADRVVVLADASKFGERSYVTVADLREIDTLVTDESPPESLAEALEAADVSVVVVES